MPILVNVRHLEKQPVRLSGEVSIEELDVQSRDEVIRFEAPVIYQLEAQKLDQAILVQGVVSVDVVCDCVRCLKTYSEAVRLDRWTVHLPLAGDDAVSVVNDSVDLTPYLREDILLALPQHPLCSKDCPGLLSQFTGAPTSPGGRALGKDQGSPWDDLDKLEL